MAIIFLVLVLGFWFVLFLFVIMGEIGKKWESFVILIWMKMKGITPMKIDKQGPWRPYWGVSPLPMGAQALGTITRYQAKTGALLLMPTGIYCQGNAGVIRPLDQREVVGALEVTP